MRVQGLDRWRSWEHSADALADQVAEPDWPVWVLADTDHTLLGVTTADETPNLGWTEQERAESALFLQSTVTHPSAAGQGLGMLVAFWALDRAARLGRRWVRRGVLTDPDGGNQGLVRYYRSQGWRVVRSVRHPRKSGITVWSLARPAVPQPELVTMVTESASVEQT
nr:hypothetical protein [Kibdelosporangium sp. MJ126-NF4]